MTFRQFSTQAGSRSFKAINPLTDEQLMQYAPSLFAEHKAGRTSGKYQYIPTAEILSGMRENGWLPTWATQQRVRPLTKDGTPTNREGFQKHMIRFRHSDSFGTALAVNDFFPEMVLVNSHDGSSSYALHAGIYRLVCGNGMVVADTTFQTIRVAHMGIDAGEIIQASYRVLEEMPKVTGQIGEWKAKQLTDGQQNAFAEAALIAKYGELETAPITPRVALSRKRTEDASASVWSTLNVLQENLTQGGQRDRSKRRDDGTRFRITSPVKGIDENVKLNKALWHLADALGKVA